MSKKAFTLIELLVVIAIIAMLLAVVVPAMKSAKDQSKKIVCMAALKQWALCYQLYTQDNNMLFPTFIWNDWENCTYMENYRLYYQDINKMRFCPSAKQFVRGVNPIDAGREMGTTTAPWWADPKTVAWMNKDDCGLASYGENSWVSSGTQLDEKKAWQKTDRIKSGYLVPMIGDARWNNALPDNTHPLPNPVSTEQQYYYAAIWTRAECFAMRRHKDGANLAFADGNVRLVDAEDMWSLQWNATYTPRRDVDLSWLNF